MISYIKKFAARKVVDPTYESRKMVSAQCTGSSSFLRQVSIKREGNCFTAKAMQTGKGLTVTASRPCS